jgi:uncharacterized SAM-binding protein YcdF (DUF218 family)
MTLVLVIFSLACLALTVMAIFAVATLWCDRRTWVKRAKESEGILNEQRRQAKWAVLYTPDGHRRRAGDRLWDYEQPVRLN